MGADVTTTALISLEPATLEVAARLAKELSGTEFVPQSLQNRPAAITAAILRGAELGIGPMLALESIAIINGRPCLSAQLMRALIRRAGHVIMPAEEPTATRCTMYGRRSDGGEDRVTWTKDDAERAGLWQRPQWKAYPRQMLVARATAELARRHFSDVIGGLLAAEEAEDEPTPLSVDDLAPPNGNRDAAPPGTRRRRLRRGAAAVDQTAPDARASGVVDPDTQEAGVDTGSQTPPAHLPAPASDPLADLTPEELAEEDRVAQLEREADEEDEDDAEPEADDIDLDATGEHAQIIAIRARELGVERAEVILAVTGNRKRSGRALTEAEGRAVLRALDMVKLGTVRVEEAEEPGTFRLVDAETTDQEVRERAFEVLKRLPAHARRALVKQAKWDGRESLPALLQRLDEAAVGSLYATARAVEEQT